ncbi:protein FAR1-RELATED SEQUENCE 9-like [Apium graveolens]|uniref:protein FAR1-RELATED SEQUENCE 9-like n=1 Tax=Apium graveolens TaxID=4045 RepID=UPI003D7B848D
MIKLGNRLCKETNFMEKMKAYIWSSVLEIYEFDIGWKEVIKEFKLEDNKWLSDMKGYTLCEFWFCFQSAMERQRNETARLDHESKTSIPETLSRWFIEDDATTLFTRAIFYKVQQEIICSCLDMQIKRMSEEIEGVTHMEIRDVKVKDKLFKVSVTRDNVVCSCKKFVMCGIVYRHAFCGMKQIEVTKYPLRLALNRWMKVDNSGTMSNSVSVENDYTKMEQASLKLTHIWMNNMESANGVMTIEGRDSDSWVVSLVTKPLQIAEA